MPLPAVAPMLAVARTELPAADTAYGYEFKWDGVRAIVYVEDGEARVMSRNDRDVSVSYPELAALPAALDGCTAILDGEIVALDAAGRPSFSRLQSRMHVADPAAARRLAAEVPARLLAFDVLHLDGVSTIDAPYEERRSLLESLGLDDARWQTPPWFSGAGSPGEGAAVFTASRSSGLEGVIAKRLGSRYFPGRRSDCWLKVKHVRMQEVVVGGWKPGQGRRAGGLGSLLLGVHDETGLRYAGHVGTGFSDRALRDLQADLAPLATDTPPFAEPVPREHARDARWVRPELVGEVVFTEWTPDGRLRHPSWRGLRPDKAPAEVVREPG